MANEEHLQRLKQGVEEWNAWRKKHPEIIIDLSEAWLGDANLNGVNLSGADLSGANITRANLSRARLSEAWLSGADLSGANLSRANLNRANLSGTRLIGAWLSGVRLIEARLCGALLSEANRSEADFTRADLSGVIFRGANLTRAIFRLASLVEAILKGATLTDACLWETQRAGWLIQGIICEAVYWDKDKKERTTYSPGEFEQLYAAKTKIVLYYEGGISPIEVATLPALIQRIESTYPGCVLRLQSVQEAPGGATVTLIVEKDGGGSPDELRTLKVAMETAAQDVIRYQRAWLKETGRREQIESMYNSLMQQMIGNSQSISVSISDSTVQGNIVGHLSGRDAEVNYAKHPSAGDAEV